MKYLLSLLLLCLNGVRPQAQNQGDIDSIIASVFGPAPGQTGGPTGGQTGGQTGGPTGSPTGGQFGAVTPSTDDVNLSPSNIGSNSGAGNPPGQPYACRNIDNEPGECVPYYLCRNDTINTDGEGIIDIRVSDGPCESYLEVCCLPPDRAPNPITPTPPPPTQVRQGCGWRNPRGVGFRIKGDNDNEAKFGEFPWMVAILKEELVDEADTSGAKLNVYVCGGSLIHPRAVLTAAHCVHQRPSQLRVRAGEWDTQTKNEIYPYQDRDVTEIILHKDFYKGALFYDIALLILGEPMLLTQNVGVACLPPAPTDGRKADRAAAGARCQASGWGKDSFGKEGRYQVILKRVEVPVVPRDQCLQKLRTTRLGRNFELHTTFMCAGGEPGKDTCKGDGGSPLVCPIEFEEDRYQQYGIVAWGIGCGENGVPGVYADVGQLRSWVDDKILSKGLDPAVYTY